MSWILALVSLARTIYFAACDSKYANTSSSCHLAFGIRQTFSAGP